MFQLFPSTDQRNQTSNQGVHRGILMAQIGISSTFSAGARQGGTVLAKKVDKFFGKWRRSALRIKRSVAVKTSQTSCTTQFFQGTPTDSPARYTA